MQPVLAEPNRQGATATLPKSPPADYYEFACAGAPAIAVVTGHPDPARIPAAAQQCCRKWTFVRAVRLGQGSYPPDNQGGVPSTV
jgi:hypothetical protein